ncbi:MAG TPA: hypothetical protein VF185_00355 [Patescibacteria group bacterium]
MTQERIEEETIKKARDMMVALQKRPVTLAEASNIIVDRLETMEAAQEEIKTKSKSKPSRSEKLI